MAGLVVSYSFVVVIFLFFYSLLALSEKMNKKVWRKEWSRETLSSYECGFEQIHKGREAFSLRFFLIAILFIIFDGEVVMLMPYITSVISSSGSCCKLLCGVFLLVLVVGLAHEKNEGSLEWVQ